VKLFHGSVTSGRLAIHLGMAYLFAATSVVAFAQAGQLDTTFANKGIFSDNFSGATGAAAAVALQSDGKIVIGGQTGPINSTSGKGIVVRLNTNGTLDNSFGSHGSVSIRFGAINDLLTGLAIQADGKIVVAGSGFAGGSGQLVRLNTDGSFDPSFGSEGLVALFPESPGPLALQTDGKIILLVPSSGTIGGPAEMQRYNTDGTLDTSFGTDGIVPLVSGASAISLLSSGKILVTSAGLFQSSVARYTSEGSLDRTFGITGQNAVLTAAATTLLSDSKIITAGGISTGASFTGNPSGFGLIRLNANGTLDGTFGSRAAVVTSFPGFLMANASALAIQTNGNIVAVGSANNGGNSPTGPFALARYLVTGQLDTTFGTSGLVTTSFGSTTQATISAVTIQTDGKIVVAGSDGAGDFVVARYLGQ
jgi:uncharacterized delta-60 repeat protein